MTNSSRWLAPIVGVCVLFCSVVQAQGTTVGRDEIKPSVSVWPDKEIATPETEVTIVTSSDPKRRHTCRVIKIDASGISCGAHFGKPPKLYRRTEVEAIRLIGDREDVLGYFTFGGIAAGVYTGLVFLAMISTPWLAVASAIGFLWTGDVLFFVLSAIYENNAPGMLIYSRPDDELAGHAASG